MRIMKKSLAMLLALTMVLSLVAINVAAGDVNKVTVQQDIASVPKSTTEDQDVTVEIYIETDATGICGFKATVACPGLTLSSLTAPEEGRVATMSPVYNAATGSMILAAAQDKVLNANTLLATAVFTVPAGTAVGEYPITIALSDADIVKVGNVPVAFTKVDSVIKVTEDKYISAITDETVGDVEYAAESVPAAPVSLTGTGLTGGGEDTSVTITEGITWDGAINTLQAPATYEVTGTVAAPDASTKVYFGTQGNTVDTLPAKYTYNIIKTDDFTVAPVAVGVPVVEGGATLTEASAIAALTDITTTTVTAGGEAEVCDATINWASATITSGTGLDLATLTDTDDTNTVELTVELSGTTDYYELAGEHVVVTFTVVPAEIEGCAVTVSSKKSTAAPTIKVTMPAAALGDGTGEFVLTITGDGEYTETIADVTTAVEGETATVSFKTAVAYKEMGIGLDSAGAEFTVGLTYDGADLLFDDATFKLVSSMSGAGSSNLPVTGGSTEPGTDVPGTDEPGTDEPGTDEPGTDEPGTDEPVVAGPFADVAADHWAADYITVLKEAGVVGGVNDTDFAPDNYITRAEYAKMIANVFGLEATATESAFVDCPADAWFTPYVAACTEAGYILGVSETEFAPEDLITREQACAILGRALNATSEAELTFADAADVDDYAKGYVAALVEMGLVNGYADGTFAPDNNITRAEAAKIIAGAFASLGEEVVEEEVVEEETTEEVVEEEATEEEVVEEETTEEAVVEEETTEEVVEEATETEAE